MRRLWYALLIVPFAGLLYPALYNRARPSAWGFPFFYWYQLAWVAGVAVLLGVFVLATNERNEPK